MNLYIYYLIKSFSFFNNVKMFFMINKSLISKQKKMNLITLKKKKLYYILFLSVIYL